MALEGTLKDFSLADIFQLIGLQRKTGVLTLKGKEDVVTVSFLEGRVVSADSLQKRLENRLGNVLIKQSRLTEANLSEALEEQNHTLQRLGFILLNRNLISEEELKDALQLQIMQIIFRLFRWKDGDYHFSQETTIEYDKDFVTPISPESILMEGARMIDEWPIIEKKIPSYTLVFKKAETGQRIEIGDTEEEDWDVDFGESSAAPAAKAVPAAKAAPLASDAIKLSSQDAFVFNLVDGVTSVGEIVEKSRLNEFETLKVLYELLNRGLILQVKKEKPLAEEAEAETVETPEERDKSAALWILVGVLWLLGSLATMHMNPLNFLTLPPRRSSSIVEIQRSMSLNRIERIGNAINAYRLMIGSYPASLAEISLAGLLSPQAGFDPWGRAYDYTIKESRLYVSATNQSGTALDTDLFFSQQLKAAAEKRSKAQTPGNATDDQDSKGRTLAKTEGIRILE